MKSSVHKNVAASCYGEDIAYFGGHFNPITVIGSKSKQGFVGCLQQFYFNGVSVTMTLKSSVDHWTLSWASRQFDVFSNNYDKLSAIEKPEHTYEWNLPMMLWKTSICIKETCVTFDNTWPLLTDFRRSF